MDDWRIEYYKGMILTEINRQIVLKNPNRKLLDIEFIKHEYRKLKGCCPTLDKVGLLKLLYKNVREGAYEETVMARIRGGD